MSQADSRVEMIRSALQTLAPVSLQVIDESHRHAGHEGARDGRGHYAVEIVSTAFAGLAPLARHRRVFEAVGSLMQTDIHALSIKARTPEEAGL
ncbi:MAG TPA: BolA family protein [Arenimonas sp.]|uniref:BolA family protein n=1 Tax=Arenimonas sp. TaxID=1872635 RepID=UPI002C353B6F|nr:BolA family protein [Arenimonas sp.]HMB56212.1 BolA family protein [Arenimonas sp.]